MMTRLTRAAVLVTAAAAVLRPVGPASAVASGPNAGSTPQCGAASHFCITPVLYAAQIPQSLAMTATARTANSPIIVQTFDPSDASQDWMLEVIGSVPPGSRRRPDHGHAVDGPRIPAPQTAYLEFSPGGIETDMCAANVNDKLVLRHCTGSNWQIFIKTESANGLIPPEFWSYFLSDVLARATGQHLALTSSRLPGSQITFAVPWYAQDQWWTESNICLTGPRRPAGSAPLVC